MTEKEKQEIIELVHKTLHDFCEPFPEGELGARPLTQTEKVLLEVNYVLCEKIKELPTIDRPRGEWIKFTLEGGFLSSHKCSNCGFNGNQLWKFCPNCGADMRKEGDEK